MKYRAKPVIIEAVQWTGENTQKVIEFTRYLSANYKENDINVLGILTLEGAMIAHVGDYIVKGLKGEYYPCKPDIFEEKYEQVGE